MNRINNYTDLVAYRKQLESDLFRQKTYLNTKVGLIKEKFEPVAKILSFFNGEKNHSAHSLMKAGSSLLKIGSNVGIDLLLQSKLSKMGWLAKLIVPFVLRFAAAKTVDKVEENRPAA